MTRRSLTVETDSGPVTVTEDDGFVVAVTWGGSGSDDSPLLRQAAGQLREYFSGTRKDFDLPLKPQGSDFQQAVCWPGFAQALRRIFRRRSGSKATIRPGHGEGA